MRITFKEKFHKSCIDLSKNWELLLLSAPAVILYFFFHYVPMSGIVMAFKDYRIAKGIWGSEWNGLENFEFLFQSTVLFRLTRNTVCYSLLFMALGIAFNIFIALLAYEIDNKKMLKFYQGAMQIPRFMSWVIVGYVTYAIFSPKYGLLNQFLELLGKEGIDVYSKASLWPYILTFCDLWKGVGMGSLLYYAQLIGIDTELFEAASLDGATKLQKIRSISLPHLVPLIVLQAILAIGGIFSGDFGLFYQIPRNIGALYETTDIINTYVYRGLAAGNYAVTSAVGLMQSMLGMIMLVLTNWIVSKVSPENTLF